MAIDVAPDVYGLTEDGSSHEWVIITGASDPRAAAAALSRAGDRFERVDEYGREFSDEEAELEEEKVLSGELKGFSYTPNHIFGGTYGTSRSVVQSGLQGFYPSADARADDRGPGRGTGARGSERPC